jgi:hypothetical protein
MTMNAGVYSVVTQIVAVMPVVLRAQTSDPFHRSDDPAWLFGTVVLVLLIPVDVWSLGSNWNYLKEEQTKEGIPSSFQNEV